MRIEDCNVSIERAYSNLISIWPEGNRQSITRKVDGFSGQRGSSGDSIPYT